MPSHSTTNRLANALAYCAEMEGARQQKEDRKKVKQEAKQEAIAQRRLNARPIQDHVYLIKASNGYYKIGISRNPSKRFKELQREALIWAVTLELVHVIPTNKAYILEQSFHKRFAEQRVIGEWFLLAQSDIAWLCSQ